jgi:hypothetical protein
MKGYSYTGLSAAYPVPYTEERISSTDWIM